MPLRHKYLPETATIQTVSDSNIDEEVCLVIIGQIHTQMLNANLNLKVQKKIEMEEIQLLKYLLYM